MPASRLTFRVGPATIDFDHWGRVVSVVHDDGSAAGYLRGLAVERVDLPDHRWTLTQPAVAADDDEVEFGYAVTDDLRLVVRHSFAAGWGVRIALTAGPLGPPVSIDALHWSMAPVDGGIGWALTAGADASFSVHPGDGDGPMLGGSLRLGSVTGSDEDGLVIGPLQLPPGGRYVVQWWWDWYAQPVAFGRDRHPDVPLAGTLFVGEAATVALDHDVAVIAPAEVEVLEADDHRDLVSDQPGSWTVDLHSARGRTSLDLCWVAPVRELLAVAAAVALSRPRTAAHVIKLAGVHEAIAVQDALLGESAQARVDDVDDAAEALDLFTARLADAVGLGPFEAAYLCGEYARTGERDLLDQATSIVLDQRAVEPGLGLAVAQLSLAAVLAGRPVDAVTEHAHTLLAGGDAGRSRPGDPAAACLQIAQLELAAVLHGRANRREPARTSPSLRDRVVALGPHLGAGLKGGAVRPLPVDSLSHLITALQLVPESVSGRLQPHWDCSAHALAQRSTPELVRQLAADHDSEVRAAHTWLIAARPPQ